MSKFLLKQYQIKPSKHLGQNFLIDKSVLRKIISAADLSKDDVVLEVGPGLGILTLELAKQVKKVIAVEKDGKMIEVLKNILADEKIKNVEIIRGDILKTDISSFKFSARGGSSSGGQVSSFKVVANIPYYLTSPLIRKFLEMPQRPESMVLMIQKEVAQRICAKPPRMSLLSVSVQFYAEPKIISYVSKKSFLPQPKVDSAIIKIAPKATPIRGLHADDADIFFRVARASFAHPRKQLLNNLSTGLKLSREKTTEIILETGLKPTARPSELSVDNYMDLAWIIWGK